MRNLALLVATIALIGGCAPASSPAPSAPPTPVPGTPAPASSASAEAAPQHVVAGSLGLEIPDGWHQRSGSLNPGGNEPFLFAGPEDLQSDCQTTAQGMTCGSWPIMRLLPDGIVIAVRFYGQPGFAAPAGGDPLSVAGLAARRISGPADGACRGIGGTDLVEVWLPPFAGANGIYSIDACTSGQGAGAAEFAAILASVSFRG
jgi:hypothetical protein